MAKPNIIIGSYMFRYPLGGMMSWVLQYLTGFKKLGCNVYFVEKFGYPNSCYNPQKEIMSNDCSYGVKLVSELLKINGLGDNWCFMDFNNVYHGLSKTKINSMFQTADVFIDMGTHGAWEEEAKVTPLKILLDGEPGFTQIKMAIKKELKEWIPEYDLYYTVGQNIGTQGNLTPTLDLDWQHVFHPVDLELFPKSKHKKHNGKFCTIMNWKSHDPIQYGNKIYGQKDIEFNKILELPSLFPSRLEVAISGKKIPTEWLEKHGWQLVSGKKITETFESFRDYIFQCQGELSVCKNIFIETQSGWFSDKSAAYLGSGKPVVLQDTGFSKHLPCGEGLFAFSTKEEAQHAIESICSNYSMHCDAALDIANEYLSVEKVLKKFLDEIGL